MYGFLTKLLISKQLSFEEGEILFFKQPMCIFPIEFYKYLTISTLRDKKIMKELYLEAWKAAYVWTYNVVNTYKLQKFEERYKLTMDTVAMAGFGEYKTTDFKRGFFSKFEVTNNPLALELYPSKKPIDHLLRGINAGGGTVVHERILNCIELECAAINGKICKFLNANKFLIIKDVNKKILKDQLLNFNEILKEEEKFLKSLGHKLPI